jgi:hypothetical protein
MWNVGFEVLTAVVMKGTIFWDITPCSPLKVNRHFMSYQSSGLKVSQARNQHDTLFFFLSFFDPEYGGDMFLRNVCSLSTGYTALYPRR